MPSADASSLEPLFRNLCAARETREVMLMAWSLTIASGLRTVQILGFNASLRCVAPYVTCLTRQGNSTESRALPLPPSTESLTSSYLELPTHVPSGSPQDRGPRHIAQSCREKSSEA